MQTCIGLFTDHQCQKCRRHDRFSNPFAVCNLSCIADHSYDPFAPPHAHRGASLFYGPFLADGLQHSKSVTVDMQDRLHSFLIRREVDLWPSDRLPSTDKKQDIKTPADLESSVAKQPFQVTVKRISHASSPASPRFSYAGDVVTLCTLHFVPFQQLPDIFNALQRSSTWTMRELFSVKLCLSQFLYTTSWSGSGSCLYMKRNEVST